MSFEPHRVTLWQSNCCRSIHISKLPQKLNYTQVQPTIPIQTGTWERPGQKGDSPKSNSRPKTPELGPADVRTIQSLKNNHLQMQSTQSLALPTCSSYECPGCHQKMHILAPVYKKMHILVPIYDSWTHSMRIHFSCLWWRSKVICFMTWAQVGTCVSSNNAGKYYGEDSEKMNCLQSPSACGASMWL